MIAALCEHYGPPENLVLRELPDPAPGPGEVLVEPSRVALNFFDTLIIENKYQVKPDLPFSPGGEFCGKVMALGEGVEGLAAGQRVAGYCSYGAARSRVVLPASLLTPVPDALSDDRAAGLFITYGTTMHALVQRADLQKGETLAVLGASGGVGLAAVEIGAAMGAQVIACASSREKLDFAQRHGAHEGLNYSSEDLKEGLKRRTGGKGVDCIYDAIGGAFSEAALRAMAWKGRFLVVGFASGKIPKIPLNLTLLKGCAILGVFWGEFVRREPEAHRRNMARIFDWAARSAISAHVDDVLPLHDIAKGLNRLKERKAQGKILLSIP
ncbi:NADPH:quinone oxidoreductase family protein [Rhodoblastus acidophilus]|uniref:NADPH:quinone oxidoreductase family protein n=1 Tax=Candidatus Rhodoblastus alkanivorans TaxID=2954117 RepID=A0ABS9Z1J1_9HYPH|nr:NADPH:quinone oxidoreductase family protein [Candidatus Rhodoblastus alkanivorans]MCI4678135.1 NADPH:quinone oxidoreductase family protein [Candidatus Rhodoblastus alkanivorans]MCI4681524.1 NADPH:quinone oxidoreductase family protein [Candidatus Rhodoblastus alkanivorans]MDI4642572.1 NADPH:quinone oxidoreductase family protein [Rhodoblastus acidophilus]